MKIRRDKLDDLFSLYMRMKANYTCEYCGQKGKVEVSHFHGRRKWITRLDEENVAVLCSGCHQRFHEHPDLHTEFFKKRLGSERLDALRARCEIVKQRKKCDDREIEAALKAKIKLLEE